MTVVNESTTVGKVSPADRRHQVSDVTVDARVESDFCKTCALYHACAMVGFGKPELSSLHGLMEHLGPYSAGELIFHQGEPFRAVFAVRAGVVKTRRMDSNGHEYVLGFHLPGEVIGLKAINPGYFPCDAIALDNTFLCRFSFPAISGLAARQPAVQHHLFRLLSKELCIANLFPGDFGADTRMAAFLVDLGERYALRGFSATRFRLSMSRGDIGNHLHLAAETVSRVLARFRAENLITLQGRDLELVDCVRMREIGRPLLVGHAAMDADVSQGVLTLKEQSFAQP